MWRRMSCPRSVCSLPLCGVFSASSAMSAPATKAFSPAPVRLTARTPSSARAAANAAARDLAEDRVLPVERCLPREADEELRAGGVGVARPRRAERARVVRQLVELGVERVTRTARAGARRVAALDHEALDHAVEDRPV